MLRNSIIILIIFKINLIFCQNNMSTVLKKTSYKELDSLIKINNGIKHVKLSERLYSRVFVLSDKRIVVIPGLTAETSGVLYPNEQELLRILNLPDDEVHYLKGIVKTKKSFLTDRENQVLKLIKIMKIDKKQLDFSVSSLALIDKKINSGEIERSTFLDTKYFFPLCIYVGEVIRNEVNGNWSFKASKDDKNVIEPYIEDIKGKQYSPFLSIYKDIDDSDEELSIESLVKIELIKREK